MWCEGVGLCLFVKYNEMTMTMKYIYLNPTLYIQWIVIIACKVPNTVKIK